MMLSLAVIALGFVKTSKSDVYIPILLYGGLVYYHYRIHNWKLPNFYKITRVDCRSRHGLDHIYSS